MMLAKFSLSPIATQISSVTTMATSSGTSVNATSRQRLSATNRIQRDRQQRPDGGLKKRFDDGRRSLDDENRRPARLRSHASHRVDETMQNRIVIAVAAWPRFDPDLAIRRDPRRS